MSRTAANEAGEGGMDVSAARRLKALEDGNVKLKKLLAQSMLDVAGLRELAPAGPRVPGDIAVG